MVGCTATAAILPVAYAEFTLYARLFTFLRSRKVQVLKLLFFAE